MSPSDLTSITTVRIHPAIGIARVGNSPDAYLFGPEVPHPVPPPADGYRDAQGRLKRQAARFRLYGYDGLGRVVGEITSDFARVTWNVHVANKKSGWYQYDMALDMQPEAANVQSARRNASIPADRRKELEIDPGPREISGPNQAPVAFDTGTFGGTTKVYLGEVSTDASGRLIFLGGHGVAGSPFPGYTLNTFANNPGWYDDTSDGPVEATVVINGKTIEADGAWVVTAPPNYAPDIVPVVSMYDLIVDAVTGSLINPASQVSFTRDILPIFERLNRLQWVNYGFFVQFGWQAPFELTRPDFLTRLSMAGDEYKELRIQIFNMFRDPSDPVFQGFQWPPIYGDALGLLVGSEESPRNGLAVTPTMYSNLQAWRDGHFEADYPSSTALPDTIEGYPPANQPEVLDQAALTFCVGGPFHPGCEITWPMRRASLYRGKFRLRRHPAGVAYPDYGEFLTQAAVLAESGPLATVGAGDLTKWMSVPWHADTASCQDGYPKFDTDTLFSKDNFLPTFWPARAPDEVFTETDYKIVVDPNQPMAQRLSAFNRRNIWLRGLNQNAPFVTQITRMVAEYGKVAVIVQKAGVANDPTFPAQMYVEDVNLPPNPAKLGAPPPSADEARPNAKALFQARYGGRRRF